MPEDELQQNNTARYAWTALVVIFILGFGAFTIKTFIHDRNRNNDTAQNTSRDQIAEQFAPSKPQDENNENPAQGQPVEDIRGPGASTPAAKPEVLGSALNTSTAQAEPTFKPYRNVAFGFSTTVPADAQVVVSGDKVTANGPSGIFWTLTKYDNTPETLDTIETQLSSSPSVTSLARTTLGNIPALVFTSPNLEGATGYAFITNGRLYYLVGNFSKPESWQDFRFF